MTFPVTRRLGAYLEMELERRRGNAPDAEDVQSLRGEVRELEAEVRRLAERQRFVDRLLSDDTEALRLREEA